VSSRWKQRTAVASKARPIYPPLLRWFTHESLHKHQLELLLQGLPNVITLPATEPKTTTAARNGAAHPVRRMLVEDKLETQEIVIEPAEVQAQPDGWKKISEERTSQLDWVAPKIIKRVYIRPRYVKQERFALAPLRPNQLNKAWSGRVCWHKFWSANMNITNRFTGRRKCSAAIRSGTKRKRWDVGSNRPPSC